SSTAATVHNLTVNAGGPYTATSGSAINFTATASDPADTSGDFTYSWSFGDGTSASGANVSHAYANPGNYTATVTVTEAGGLTASANATLTTAAAPASQPFPNNQTPPPLPPPTGTVINVSTVSQLESAVANLQSNQTILIAPGTYNLTGTLVVPQGLTNISIRGATGN